MSCFRIRTGPIFVAIVTYINNPPEAGNDFYICNNWNTAYQLLKESYYDLDGKNYKDFQQAIKDKDFYIEDSVGSVNAVFEIRVMPIYDDVGGEDEDD